MLVPIQRPASDCTMRGCASHECGTCGLTRSHAQATRQGHACWTETAADRFERVAANLRRGAYGPTR